MGYKNLRACVDDLRRTNQLVEVSIEVDPKLELAEIQRRAYRKKSPALLFTKVKGTRFPMLANLFGTIERTRFLFRDRLRRVQDLVDLKTDPSRALKKFWRYWSAPVTAWSMLPKSCRNGPVLQRETTLSQLPQLKCWPADGGAFVTLPLVYTESPHRPGWQKSNLGMYRVQISGNDYEPDRECGLHYQIHRGIGVHHSEALTRGERLPVAVVVGGPPSLILSAVMPLPEGMPELTFAGALGGHRVGLVTPKHSSECPRALRIPAEADFVIYGYIDPTRTKPEGPFGDHLGYYSLTHDFPVMTVERVYHRPDAIWPFTVVGRPPQEDTSFGEIIHEITAPILPTVLPGVKAVHAVDVAGVHPLLLAIGSERYVPYAKSRQPQELLTIANAILGQGQLSLAKYLFIAAHEDNPRLDIHNLEEFFRHILERVHWERDLHFQTRTTIDTLDYTGNALNEGSKVVIACAGEKCRELATRIPEGISWPAGTTWPQMGMAGVLIVQAPPYSVVPPSQNALPNEPYLQRLLLALESQPEHFQKIPLIILVDDSVFAAARIENWVWATFTRSNPATDIWGVGARILDKHWGCTGPLVIDARRKPRHAPPLIEDPEVTKKVDALAAHGGPLYGLID